MPLMERNCWESHPCHRGTKDDTIKDALESNTHQTRRNPPDYPGHPQLQKRSLWCISVQTSKGTHPVRINTMIGVAKTSSASSIADVAFDLQWA